MGGLKAAGTRISGHPQDREAGPPSSRESDRRNYQPGM